MSAGIGPNTGFRAGGYEGVMPDLNDPERSVLRRRKALARMYSLSSAAFFVFFLGTSLVDIAPDAVRAQRVQAALMLVWLSLCLYCRQEASKIREKERLL